MRKDPVMAVIVTFDVFSALTDSRSGGSATLQTLSEAQGWSTSGSELYDIWDAANKENHRAVERWCRLPSSACSRCARL
jgi:2-haloacid dehalogenase